MNGVAIIRQSDLAGCSFTDWDCVADACSCAMCLTSNVQPPQAHSKHRPAQGRCCSTFMQCLIDMLRWGKQIVLLVSVYDLVNDMK